MKYLSHYLTKETPLYGNLKENLQIEEASCICSGEVANSLKITFNNHVGTHIDLPNHFDATGAVLNDFPASSWRFNQVQLIDLPCEGEYLISISDLQDQLSSETDLLLIRTGFENFRGQKKYWNNNPGVNNKVGVWLRENYPNLRAIGFDFISLNCYQKEELGCLSHQEFLAANYPNKPILIIEDMKLAEAGNIDHVIVAPLLIDGADGVPVTVFAIEN